MTERASREKDGTEPTLPARDLAMYDVSGHGPVGEHAFDRYVRDKSQDEAIAGLAKDSLDNMIRKASPGELPALIRSALLGDDEEALWSGISLLKNCPPTDRNELYDLLRDKVLADLGSDDKKKRGHALVLISDTRESDRYLLLRRALESPDRDVVLAAARVADHRHTGHNEVDDVIAEKIDTALTLDDPDSVRWAKNMITYCKPELAEQFQDRIKKRVIDRLDSVEREEFKLRVHLINYVPYNLRAGILRTALGDADSAIVINAASRLYLIPKGESVELWTALIDRVRSGLESTDASIQSDSLDLVGTVPVIERSSLLHIALASADPRIRNKAAALSSVLPVAEEEKFIDDAIAAGCGNALIAPGLYGKYDLNDKEFERVAFEKTGSGTTLIGGALMERAIVRHITPQAFLAWQRAFENTQMWRNAGFDYVPIEPIISYHLNADGLVDVFSGVLDLSLGDWKHKSSKWSAELEAKRNAILDALSGEEVAHGHAHLANFCLRFFRDERGEPDFTRTPRLYLIDFDRAVSPSKKPADADSKRT